MIWDFVLMSLLFIGPIVLLHVAGAVRRWRRIRRYFRRESSEQRTIRRQLTEQQPR